MIAVQQCKLLPTGCEDKIYLQQVMMDHFEQNKALFPHWPNNGSDSIFLIQLSSLKSKVWDPVQQ